MTEAIGDAEVHDRSLEHLLARLNILSARVQSAVTRRRREDPGADDRFRGLYISDDAVDDLLANRPPSMWDPVSEELSRDVERKADLWELEGNPLRLRGLAAAFGLDLTGIDILVAALAPDLDPRFERLYGYLNDDVTRRRATIGLALELCGLVAIDADARARLSPSGSLVGGGLIAIEDEQRPSLTRSLCVPDRVVGHLLGDDAVELQLAAVIDTTPLPAAGPSSPSLERALREGIWPIYVREAGTASGIATAASSAAALGAGIVALDLRRLVGASHPVGVIATAIRETRLRGAVLVAAPIEALVDGSAGLISRLAEAQCPIVLAGARGWDPAWSRVVPVLLDAPALVAADRVAEWQAALAPAAGGIAMNGHAQELLDATRAFRLSAPQIARAALAGRLRARAEARDLEPGDVQAGARAQNAAGLDRLARRIEPRAGWDDLVLPSDARAQLHELASRARHREQVLDEWGIGGRSTRGRGITALFAGESGTGKTLAAEVITGELGLDLYVIDLSTVVDKYIGETEKNLDRIFAEADRVNAVLLFDEADAIFGKRSEVRDARDRYANLEVAYLLQRMERFDGMAVLSTNLRANLDEAFTRRIDVIADFPMPDEDARLALWRLHLPASLPQTSDLDLEFMARRFRLSGGNIRNICLTSAFLAAEDARPTSMAHLIRATEREYRKLGRLTLEAEFGPYHALLVTAPSLPNEPMGALDGPN